MLVWSGLVWSIYILFPQLRSYLLLIFSLLQSFSDMLYGRFAKLMEDIYIYIYIALQKPIFFFEIRNICTYYHKYKFPTA